MKGKELFSWTPRYTVLNGCAPDPRVIPALSSAKLIGVGPMLSLLDDTNDVGGCVDLGVLRRNRRGRQPRCDSLLDGSGASWTGGTRTRRRAPRERTLHGGRGDDG